MKIQKGEVEVSFSARGIPSYSIELSHEGLKKHRVIKGGDKDVLLRKADIQISEWKEKWVAEELKRVERLDRNSQKQKVEDGKVQAGHLTSEAMREQRVLSGLLKATLIVNDAVNWDDLKCGDDFSEPAPIMPSLPPAPKAPERILEPKRTDEKYQPKLGILDWLIPSRKADKISAMAKIYENDCVAWTERWENKVLAAKKAGDAWERKIDDIKKMHKVSLIEWEAKKQRFNREKEDQSMAIDRQRQLYLSGDAQAISDYCDLVLSRSIYPSCFPKEFDLVFEKASRMLVIDYALPAPTDLPRVKEVKYIAGKNDFEYQQISDAAFYKNYDDVLYQIALRTVHEIFESDVISAIEIVVFNGFVSAVSMATGRVATTCVLSFQVDRSTFCGIDLGNVDPKTCFKSLKGVGSAKLSGLVAIPPIVNLKKDDRRFVPSYEVANMVDESVNLAAMDWEDFEHLVREIFEKEFRENGGEVKVTRASRDGGIDAVAFDPDPIKGGKVVIQAKRYTNTVGVGAVRDLYGAVMNEGANKGILVTTSEFGPDSYSFANGKPLALISGSNLLFLLEKHGHKAKIDVQEAKRRADFKYE